ncbi:MAG: right-handed parallel beta-helix repeat-containing protein, partial [Solirubrobacterales bacterium]
MRRRLCLIAGACVLALPGTASAANTYVDQTRPNNDGGCLTPATACKTFTGPGGAVAKAGPDDTIFAVDPAAQTTYNDTIVLSAGKSLVAQSPDPAETIIDNGAAAAPAVTVSGTGTGQVRGFTIRSDHRAIEIHRPATIRDNVFDDPGPITTTFNNHMEIGFGAGSPLITDNTFVDPAPTTTENQIAIVTTSSGSPTISDNEFDDFLEAVFAGGSATSSPKISGNDIAGTRVAVNAGAGIGVIAGTPTITDNFIHDPVLASPNDFITGISIDQGGGGAAGATLKRNRILGHRWGVTAEDTSQPVSLESDLIAQSVV